ncbi:hypothetical protein ACFXJ8_37355 [Nonomuraea sp. NPDC059194]
MDTTPVPANVEIVARLKSRDREDGPSTADILEAVAEGRVFAR